jgi:hypothetical protein
MARLPARRGVRPVLTPHSPAFASALAAVDALLGPADATERAPLPAADSHVTVARWGRDGGVSLTVRAYDDVPDVVLVAERLDDSRAWTVIGEHSVRDACAWLSWQVPRPPRVGYDANGSPVEAA